MKIKTYLIVLLLLVGLVGAVHALTVVEEAKLTASNGETGDVFGWSVAISGDNAVIGAPYEGGLGDYSGAAYIFRRRGGNWVEVAELTAIDGAGGDFFGARVAISGNTAVIGAPGGDGLFNDYAGAAYIFQRRGREWVEVTKLTASDGEVGDQFGNWVAISRDIAVIGAPYDEDLGEESGAAYIFQRRGREWVEVTKLTASDGEAGDLFGNRVAISGNTAVIGVENDDDLGSNAGAAYIFQRSGREWVEVAKLTASDGEASDQFSTPVAINGDTVLIGALYDDDLGTDSGAAYIFQRRGREWVEVAKLTASDGEASDQFGFSVSISRDTAVIGARYDDDLGTDSGAAYIFQRRGSRWTEVAKLIASGVEAEDWFGFSVSISGNIAVIGAIQDDDLGSRSGSAYIYKLR